MILLMMLTAACSDFADTAVVGLMIAIRHRKRSQGAPSRTTGCDVLEGEEREAVESEKRS